MKIYILCINHKKAYSFIEILKIFTNEELAYISLNNFNKDRPIYGQAVLKIYEVKECI